MRAVITGVLCLISTMVTASVKVNGHFLVTSDACPAYVSKNNHTNPDHLFVYRSEEYELKEINRSSSPDWFRVQVSDNPNPLRWVSGQCGQASYDVEPSRCDKSPGMANSYLLALSWQPGFCETYGYEAGKPECQHLRAGSFASSHFTLHGLWPDQEACGINYGFCAAQKRKGLCDYDPVPLADSVAQQLAIVMPSYAEGSCLERHEWNKHGSCQLLSADDYFSQAIDLAEQVNDSSFRQYISSHVGAQVGLKDVFAEFEKSFGEGSANKLHLTCSSNSLVDVYITVPVLSETHNDLSALLAHSEGHSEPSRGCAANFTISDFTGTE